MFRYRCHFQVWLEAGCSHAGAALASSPCSAAVACVVTSWKRGADLQPVEPPPPAEAGAPHWVEDWIPAFAGMTT